MKYRKKPVVIEAFKFVGYFKGVAVEPYPPCWAFDGLDTGVLTFDSQDDLYVNTLEGKMLVSIGDYIIKGIQGELYPCKSDIFEASYELAEKEIIEPTEDQEIKMGINQGLFTSNTDMCSTPLDFF